MKQYRIGDYAKYLGVTPDLLKHYEEMGIIQSQRSDSGYRYYPFHTTALLIESIRLRNYGLTLREIREILSTHSLDNEQVEQLLAERMDRLGEEVRLDEALLEDYAAFQTWRQPLDGNDRDWEIRWSEAMCFLPHTDRDDFLKDPRIYEILSDWMSFVPIVKSCMRVEPDGLITWGFLATERDVRRLRLPTNPVVESIPTQKIFYYKFRAQVLRMEHENPTDEPHEAFRQPRALGLAPTGSYFREILRHADWRPTPGYQYGYSAIPIR